MDSDGYVQKLLAEGRKDEEIIKHLTGAGWSKEDAQQALYSAKRPPLRAQLTKADMLIAVLGLLGILLLLWTWFEHDSIYFGNHPIRNFISELWSPALLCVALLVLA
jgi:hypothetical protein